jgi:membrane-bound serine protease (ClpP class)
MLELFVVLLVSGLLLIAAEIFVPGGILGTLGAFALLGSMGTAFVAFGPVAGLAVAGAILVMAGIVVALWIKFFPSSGIGRRMTVSIDLAQAKAGELDLAPLAGKTGIAVSELRPAGFATLDGRRIDVVTQGEMIARGATVRVVKVEGNRVVVTAAAQA